jgi:hypothetical protein
MILNGVLFNQRLLAKLRGLNTNPMNLIQLVLV